MAVRGIRGAITVARDDKEEIYLATRVLLQEMIQKNGLSAKDLISIIFTVTPDLSSAFPATAARDMGLSMVPLICTQEIPVPGALPLCIRVLMHVDTPKTQGEISHRFLRTAAQLRPDLAATD
ncbi:MAG: chorismate mutase [Syntrophomonadaceae bacterium]|nr:chorismate mutase [Syntrophomonadaceae bacterium]